jgi:hypothetical protein
MVNVGERTPRRPSERCEDREATRPAIVDKVSAAEWKPAP